MIVGRRGRPSCVKCHWWCAEQQCNLHVCVPVWQQLWHALSCVLTTQACLHAYLITDVLLLLCWLACVHMWLYDPCKGWVTHTHRLLLCGFGNLLNKLLWELACFVSLSAGWSPSRLMWERTTENMPIDDRISLLRALKLDLNTTGRKGRHQFYFLNCI